MALLVIGVSLSRCFYKVCVNDDNNNDFAFYVPLLVAVVSSDTGALVFC